MDDIRSMAAPFALGDHSLAQGECLFFIAGPCVLESEHVALEVAKELARLRELFRVPIVFKSSYDKANRTSVTSFRGPGLDEGLTLLAKVRRETGLPLISDIHSPNQAAKAGEVLDVIQIPAFLSRQTDLLVAAGLTGKPVNIKKGQFQAPGDMEHAVRKVLSTGNARILLTERGTTFGYNDLVVDMRSIVRMRQFGFPVVFDATHSVQSPGGGDGCSGGDRSLVPALAKAAVAAGADGIFMEVHPDPDKALCDGPNSVALADVESLMLGLLAIRDAVGSSVRASAGPQAPLNAGGYAGPSLEERLKKVRLIIFDVDGVLTDGRITFGSSALEIKSFHVRDGHGIKLAMRCGLEIALVTGRSSDVVARRATDLGITRVYQGIWDKRPVLEELLDALALAPEQVAVVGDDVVDIPLLRRVGAGFTVPEAPLEVRHAAHWVTIHPGGNGAAREVVELILKAQERWDEALARYYQ